MNDGQTRISERPEALRGKPRVLLVDDDVENIHALMESLRNDYAIAAATDGQQALTVAARPPRPDIILLDVLMPGMDGYEVCRRLKADEQTADIPVVFVSALTETADKVLGFNLGGLDYITKPYQFEEVHARVRTHIELHRLQAELRAKNRHLAELERMKNSLTQMIVHDLRTPLSGAMGYLELARLDMNDAATERCERNLDGAMQCLGTMRSMVTALLDVARLEENSMPIVPEPRALRPLVDECVGQLRSLSTRHPLVIEDAGGISAYCDGELVRRVVQNLVANAMKFSPEEAPIEIALCATDAGARVTVSDQGPGIRPEHHHLIFEKFAQIDMDQRAARHGSGLGLTFCKLAIEAQGGEIGVENRRGGGAQFWFTLPAGAP